MPFLMKIQPVDTDVAVEVRPPAAAKPQSLLKRLFEKQFPGLRSTTSSVIPVTERTTAIPIRIGETKEINKDCGSVVVAGEFEPSSVCLAKMVQNFLEESNEKPSRCGRTRCNCFNGYYEDSSDDYDVDLFCLDTTNCHHRDPSEILKSSVPCTSTKERNLLADVTRVLENNRKSNRKIDRQRRVLVDELIKLGYDSAICKSRWEKTSAFPAGEYEYIDVMMEGGERVLVDIDFKSEFEIARSTKSYRSLLQIIPTIFVGETDRVQQIVAIMSEAAKQSMKKRGLHLPPWRKPEYMRSKWISSHQRFPPPSEAKEEEVTVVGERLEEKKLMIVVEGGGGDDGPVQRLEEKKLMIVVEGGGGDDGLVQRLEKSGEPEVITPTVIVWHPPPIETKPVIPRGGGGGMKKKIVTGLGSIL